MSSQKTWERALERYADSLYRLALLRDPVPARAAQATAAAFERIDWSSVALDDQLEARLIAALPPLSRRIRDRLRRPTRRLPVPLPAGFWKLPPATRLALGMRLARGHNSAAIALALNQPLEDVRLLLGDAIARLAGDEPTSIDPTCRHSRALRLDEPGLERLHVLGCEACRAAVPRYEAAEQSLADALGRTTVLTLPRQTVEAISLRLRAATTPSASTTRSPVTLRTASVVLAVLVVIGLLIVPRGSEPTAAQPALTARTMLQQALDTYGSPPDGIGVHHQRIMLMMDDPRTVYNADVWTDAVQPARHRMQLLRGNTVHEWQSGDGTRAWRYFTQPGERFCGLPAGSIGATSGRISRWAIDGEQQAMLRAARWQTGPWALGRQLMEQALAAPTLRSLGMGADGEATILTLAAEGGSIRGTLLLRLDGATSSLREIRQLTADNGQTYAETRWKLVSQERITSEAATRSSVFTTYPTNRQPRELNRQGEILDPACPLPGQENTASIAKVIGTTFPPIVGFRTLPPELNRAYLLASRMDIQNSPLTYNPDSLVLVYMGSGKRLVLRPRTLFLQMDNGASRIPAGETVAGEWQLQLDTDDVARFSGTASHREPISPTDITLLQWDFLAEGWTREQLIDLLSNIQHLRLRDWLDQHTAYFEPEPIDPRILSVVVPGTRLLEPVADRIDHFVVERELRPEPRYAGLIDPYHRLPTDGRTETWISYDDSGGRQRSRTERWQPNGQRLEVQWDDPTHTYTYDVRANVLREDAALDSGFDTFVSSIQYWLRPLFMYDGFEITARDDKTMTIATTLPIAETHYQMALQVQQPPLSYWQDWPSFSGMVPQSLTFQLAFDVKTGIQRELLVTIPGPNGPITIERVTIVAADVGVGPPAEGWEFVPPAGTTRIPPAEPGGTFASANQDRIATTDLSEVVGMIPARLWGWPQADYPLTFGDAYMPRVHRSTPYGYETISLAVIGGFGVELHYYQDRSEPIALLQGPADLLRLLLQQTPAAWTTSEQRILPIAGRRRPAWIMHSKDRHRAIFQLEQTLIVLDYHGEHFDDVVLPALADLEPLE